MVGQVWMIFIQETFLERAVMGGEKQVGQKDILTPYVIFTLSIEFS